jgi:predicted nucleic acid-binding Zn finger protein
MASENSGDQKRPAWWGNRRGVEIESARKRRALEQRILFGGYRASDSIVTFDVLGTTGKCYIVRFSSTNEGWSCTCPDYALRGRGHRCKHIYFVLARVLHVSIVEDAQSSAAANSGSFKSVEDVEAAMITQQVARQFVYDPTPPSRDPTKEADAPPPPPPPASAPSSLALSASDVKTVVPDRNAGVKQRPYLGDDCAICYETFTPECAVFYCNTTCGKTVHRGCFQRLVDFKGEPMCPYCRADMRPEGMVAAKRRRRVDHH